MKKLMVGLVFAMAAAALVVSPAMADIKVTTQGYMQVQSLYMSGLPLKVEGAEGCNSWYNMEMILQPTLHINDKVRIHAQIRMMERNFSGTLGGGGDIYSTNANNDKYNVWGDKQNNFWLERLYTSFDLFGGVLNVGRMSGGNWGHDFGDLDQNRDRIYYFRKLGPFTVLGLIEKLRERDGGLAPTRLTTVSAINTSQANYKTDDADIDAYAVAAVLPFSKNIIVRPLVYYIRDGVDPATGKTIFGGSEPIDYWVFILDGIYKFGPVGFEHEIDYRFRNTKGTEASGGGIDYTSWGIWAELNFNPGPLRVALDGFWLSGGDHDADSKDRTVNMTTTGNKFQPLLLAFSEDMGFFYASTGVDNGSLAGENSGYLCFYAPVSFKISDAMKIGGVLGYIRADKMNKGSKVEDGGTASKSLGWEVDVNFTWKFMDNISYILDAGLFLPGDYWKDRYDLSDRNVYGVRNGIKIEW